MTKLEKEMVAPYTAWKAGRSPVTNKGMLTALQPSIDKGINIHMPGQSNPLLNSQAKLMALRALDTYDPEKAALGTHVINTLQGLKRQNTKMSSLLKVPERAAQEHGAILGATRELTEELGYEPDETQVADRLGIAVSRIRKLHGLQHGISEGSFEGDNMYASSSGAKIPNIVIDLVADDLGSMDRRIFDHTLGLRGREVKSATELARMLKVSPGYISQRRRSIQEMMDRVQYVGV
mgnify:CR=1 FL=1